MIKKTVICFLILISSGQLFGAFIAYYSGDISYKYISGSCVSIINYEITLNLTTGKKTPGDSVVIYYGDGDSSFIKRIDSIKLGNGLIKNIYRCTHLYSSCGTYSIYYYDNINKQYSKNYYNKGFFAQCTIYADPIYPPNNSLIDYNSSALHINKNTNFKLNSCSSANGTFVYDSTVYSFYIPSSLYVPSGVKLNKYTGEFTWQNPDTTGIFFLPIQSKTYKYGFPRSAKTHCFIVRIVAPPPSFIYDSLATLPVNSSGYFEFSYNSGSTYTFCAKYRDPSADSVRLFIYPLDFFNTPLQYTYTVNNTKNHFIYASWSPVSIDVRDYHYNLVLNARSYYGTDSVSNSYQTVSYRYVNSTIGISEITLQNDFLSVYPNPSTGLINIFLLDGEFDPSEIQIFNSIGQTVLISRYHDQIDVSELISGYYFICVKGSNEKRYYHKFIKE